MIAACVACLSACSVNSVLPRTKPKVSVIVEGQDRIRFSGKGAGAGMMMSSTMGAMGIAIGVAIDEGIGKDIQSAFEQAGGDFSELVHQELSSWISEHCNVAESPKALCREDTTQATIYHYGFILKPGENDPIAPDLKIGISMPEEDERMLNNEYKTGQDESIPLEQAKQDGHLIEQALRSGLRLRLNQLALQELPSN